MQFLLSDISFIRPLRWRGIFFCKFQLSSAFFVQTIITWSVLFFLLMISFATRSAKQLTLALLYSYLFTIANVLINLFLVCVCVTFTRMLVGFENSIAWYETRWWDFNWYLKRFARLNAFVVHVSFSKDCSRAVWFNGNFRLVWFIILGNTDYFDFNDSTTWNSTLWTECTISVEKM